MSEMSENNVDNKFECPEGYKECAALELISNGGGIVLDKTANTHAVLSNGGIYMGQVYCSDPQKCTQNYIKKILIEQKRQPAQRREHE